MRVLFVASECAPFVKTGGLADVVSALPKALAAEGVEARVLLPAYPSLETLVREGRPLGGLIGPEGTELRLIAASAGGLDLLLLDAPSLFARPGNPYLGPGGRDWPDNHLRFAALAMAGAALADGRLGDWRPQILHAHDWQAALAPAYLHYRGDRSVGTVTTIHNIAFQGLFPPQIVDSIGLPQSGFVPDGFEFYGSLGYLKAGLAYADRITTVSPTYAREVLTPEFGMGLEGLLAARRRSLSGILNGIDTEIWNPADDRALEQTYDVEGLSQRAANRAAVETRFGLEPDAERPLFCVISRLTRQKGLDLLLEVLPRMMAQGARLAVLGSGDADLEAGFRAAAAAAPGRVGAVIGYDERLSHLLQGGADGIVIPSRFEPCGLTQLYGLRYGCLPLVSRTGGLADTVIDANDAALVAGAATGFQFAPASAARLADALDRACALFADRPAWSGMMRRAMHHPVGWDRSAKTYRRLYDDILREKRGNAPPAGGR